MDMATKQEDCAFAVPPPLFAGRKRRAAAPNTSDSFSFFTAEDFNAFSIRGDVYESRFYGGLERRRWTVLSANSGRKSADTALTKPGQKHLLQRLWEAIEAHHIQPPNNREELENGQRRISSFSVAEHERYLALQRTLVQAQQRGLPGVLALSQDEMKFWKHLENEVKGEQTSFCKMVVRALAAEATSKEAFIPPFVDIWYQAMIAQCRNDVYRLYPRFFEPSVVVKLPSVAVLGMAGSAAPPVNAKEVATRGRSCVIDLVRLVDGQPLLIAEGDTALNVVSPRQAISADPQADKLMEQYDCDVAISSSTLVTLFDSDTSVRFTNVPSAWGIPMKSRATLRKEGSTQVTKKRIFLDRPLPGSRTTVREKIADAGRAALLSRFEAESVAEGSTGGRVAYHVWQLEDKRILVRSTTHAFMTSSVLPSPEEQNKSTSDSEGAKGITKQKATPLSVFVKPDYRVLGVEELLTTSERCRFWLHSWLRGGSTVLVARLDHKTNSVDSWKTYSPTSLIYGENTKQSPTLELFDPLSKFQWLATLFNSLSDIPVGTCLLRSKGAYGKRSWGVEVLMAASEPASNAPETNVPPPDVVDLHRFMPTNEEKSSIAPDFPHSALPVWNLPDRIPYTFLAGTYCLPFFLDGLCPSVANGKDCGCAHLRLPMLQKRTEEKRWEFENYTNMLKKVAIRNNKGLYKPTRVVLSYGFCGEARAPPPIASITDLRMPVHCSKPANECKLPHFTLHDVLERVSDEQLRKGRQKRNSQKREFRLRQVTPRCL